MVRMTAHDITLGLLSGQLKFLSGGMDITLVSKDTGFLEAFANKEGVSFHRVDMARQIAPWTDLKSLWHLYRYFRKTKPDIVHANTPKGALLGMLAAKMALVPHRLYNVNGLRFETATGLLRKLLVSMERIACACSTKVIPQSLGVAEVLRNERITSKPLKVIHNGGNGVNLNYFNPKTPQVIADCERLRHDGVTFVFVGRIVGDKGVNELVRAFSRLSRDNKDVKLLLLGSYEETLDPVSGDTHTEIEHNPQIEFVGYQNDVRPWLLASDVLVLPSYREGFPNVVLQAGAMGLPCIVTDANGCKDVIINMYNGLIIKKRDSQGLYEAMKTLAGDSVLRQQMASVARKEVENRFNQQDVWAAILEMYNAL